MQTFCNKCSVKHNIQPTTLVKIVEAFQNGDLQVVTKEGVESKCIGDIFKQV